MYTNNSDNIGLSKYQKNHNKRFRMFSYLNIKYKLFNFSIYNMLKDSNICDKSKLDVK